MVKKFIQKNKIYLALILVMACILLFARKKQVYTVYDEAGKAWEMEVIRPLWSSYSNKLVFKAADEKFTRDFKGKYEHNIYKVQTGRVNAETKFDIAFGVYNKAPSHKVYAKRMFIYYIKDGRLLPKFRCSRFVTPMVDFALADLDGDGYDEIYTLEKYQGIYTINMYRQYDLKIERLSTQKLNFKAEALERENSKLYIKSDKNYQVILKNKEVKIYED